MFPPFDLSFLLLQSRYKMTEIKEKVIPKGDFNFFVPPTNGNCIQNGNFFLLEFFQEELYDGLKERRVNCIKINNVAININSSSSCGLFPVSIILMPEESQTLWSTQPTRCAHTLLKIQSLLEKNTMHLIHLDNSFLSCFTLLVPLEQRCLILLGGQEGIFLTQAVLSQCYYRG